MNNADIDILEPQYLPPERQSGGMAFGMLPDTAADITKKVKAVSKHPVMVKLTQRAGSRRGCARLRIGTTR
ncbi:MAG: hypothetical protein R2912_04695 [Eubacteriales bacterium]